MTRAPRFASRSTDNERLIIVPIERFAHGTLRNLPPTQPRTVYAYRNREDPQTIGSCSRGSGAGIPNGQALLPGFT